MVIQSKCAVANSFHRLFQILHFRLLQKVLTHFAFHCSLSTLHLQGPSENHTPHLLLAKFNVPFLLNDKMNQLALQTYLILTLHLSHVSHCYYNERITLILFHSCQRLIKLSMAVLAYSNYHHL